jgi:elongation factor P
VGLAAGVRTQESRQLNRTAIRGRLQMASLPAGQLKRGQAIDVDAEIYVVNALEWVKPGKGPAYVQLKLRHVKTSKLIDRRFRSAETVETINVDRRKLQYSYDQGSNLVFMDPQSYEQIEIPAELVGDDKKYLRLGTDLDVQLVDGQALGVLMPTAVVLEVVETEPGLKKVAATDVTKPATTETGLKVNVPVFINQGDKIKIDTTNGKYLERVSTG